MDMEIQQLEFLKHLFRSRRRVYRDHNATTNVSRRGRRKMNATAGSTPRLEDAA
jgi:hypothetical protein